MCTRPCIQLHKMQDMMKFRETTRSKTNIRSLDTLRSAKAGTGEEVSGGKNNRLELTESVTHLPSTTVYFQKGLRRVWFDGSMFCGTDASALS